MQHLHIFTTHPPPLVVGVGPFHPLYGNLDPPKIGRDFYYKKLMYQLSYNHFNLYMFSMVLVMLEFVFIYFFFRGIHEVFFYHLASFPSSRETISWSRIEPPTTPFDLGTSISTIIQ